MMSWLWLACGTALLPFTLLQTTVAAAAWLAPVFLLRFARTTPARWAMPSLAVTGALATYVSFRGAVPMGQMLLLTAGGAVLTPIPYAVWSTGHRFRVLPWTNTGHTTRPSRRCGGSLAVCREPRTCSTSI
jgi:hypothetical protein